MPFDLLTGRFIAEKSNIWRDANDGYHDWASADIMAGSHTNWLSPDLFCALSAQLREHLDAGAPLNSADHCGDPPLVLAAGNGHLSCTRLLVEEGADLEQRSVMKETPLIRAAHNGKLVTSSSSPASPV